jgi:hypothetical protein
MYLSIEILRYIIEFIEDLKERDRISKILNINIIYSYTCLEDINNKYLYKSLKATRCKNIGELNYNFVENLYVISTNALNFNNFPKLRKMTLDDKFNGMIFFPNWLRILKMGRNFNQPYLILPENLLYLKLGHEYNQYLDLPNKLEYFKMGHAFIHKIILPDSLKEFIMGNCFTHKISIPYSLIKLHIGQKFNNNIYLSNNLKYLHIGPNFNQDINLPISLIELSIYGNVNFDLKKLTKLKKFTMSHKFNDYIELPDSLETLILGYNFNQKIDLKNVKTIIKR